MSTRVFILGGACVAVALGGCSLTPSKTASSGAFTGQAAGVATTLNLLASDAGSTGGADICKNVFAKALLAKINKLGDCATIINNQLKTADDFTLTIKKINVVGSTATASVQTVRYGKKVIQTVHLQLEPAGWRIDSAV